ncbi:MAG TPA: phage baseplate assembly protein V, partial [Haliangium sp.]|nr:phage baseplate assembly protein V [Haliangium sp.]
MSIDQLMHIVEGRVLGRYHGKYVGVVTHVDDPRELGRIRARVPEILGLEESGWALPAPPFGGGKNYGILFMPRVGDTVWIEFAAGDLGRPIWSGGFWGAPETTGGTRDLAVESGNELPTGDGEAAVKPGDLVMRTKAGHRLIFDDGGEIAILANGNGKTEIRLTR